MIVKAYPPTPSNHELGRYGTPRRRPRRRTRRTGLPQPRFAWDGEDVETEGWMEGWRTKGYETIEPFKPCPLRKEYGDHEVETY